MHKIDLMYKSFVGNDARADVTIFGVGDLPNWLWPGMIIAVATDPPDYQGLSVENGIERIALTLLTHENGVSPFNQSILITHFTQMDADDVQAARAQLPSFAVPVLRWNKAHPRQPNKLEVRVLSWRPVPFSFYPTLLTALDEPTPTWVQDLM